MHNIKLIALELQTMLLEADDLFNVRHMTLIEKPCSTTVKLHVALRKRFRKGSYKRDSFVHRDHEIEVYSSSDVTGMPGTISTGTYLFNGVSKTCQADEWLKGRIHSSPHIVWRATEDPVHWTVGLQPNRLAMFTRKYVELVTQP